MLRLVLILMVNADMRPSPDARNPTAIILGIGLPWPSPAQVVAKATAIAEREISIKTLEIV